MHRFTFLALLFVFLIGVPTLATQTPVFSLPNNMTSSNDNKYPVQTLLDVEKYPIAPPELSLQQVHIFVRHGERTPVRVRMSGPPASIPAHWTLCRTARQFHAAVATFGEAVRDSPRTSDGVDFLPVKRIVEQRNGSVAEGECLLGELTDIGRQSTHNYGRALRKLYVEKLGFLPDTLSDINDGYFRSTNMARTIESLQQIVHGLYPRSKLAHGIIPQIRIRNGADENLIPNTSSCPRLGQLLVSFAKAAAAAYNHTLEPLDAKLSKYIEGRPIRVDGQPRASGILDTIRASKANGIKVPPEFEDEQIIGLIERAVVTEWFADKTEEPRRLGLGPLLHDLSQKMSLVESQTAQSSQGPTISGKTSGTQVPPPRILVHSTHDTLLAALLSTLDIFDEKWPPFTSSVTFELFKKTKSTGMGQTSYLQTVLSTLTPFKSNSKPSEHFVRVRYQNQDKVLPFCADKDKHLDGHPEFCTLSAFQERVRALVPDSWESACVAKPTAANASS